jgi:hypothetical protein
VFDDEHFWHPLCANVSVAKFSDDGHNRHLSSPSCGAQFSCDAMVISNQCISLVFGLRHCCHGWSVAGGPVTSVLFTAVKTTDLVSK